MKTIFYITLALGICSFFSCQPNKKTSVEALSSLQSEKQEFALTDTVTLHLFDDEERIITLSSEQLEKEKLEFISYIQEKTGEKIKAEDINDSLVINLAGQAYLENFAQHLVVETMLMNTEEDSSFNLAGNRNAAYKPELEKFASLDEIAKNLRENRTINFNHFNNTEKAAFKEAVIRAADTAMRPFLNENLIRNSLEKKPSLHQTDLKKAYFDKALLEKLYDVKIKKVTEKKDNGTEETYYQVVDSKKVYAKYDKMGSITSNLLRQNNIDLGNIGDNMYLGMLPNDSILKNITGESDQKIDNVFSLVEDFELLYALKNTHPTEIKDFQKNLDPASPATKFPKEIKALEALYKKRIDREGILAEIENLKKNTPLDEKKLQENEATLATLDNELKEYNFESFEDSFQNYFRKNHEERYKILLNENFSKTLGVNKWTQYSTPDRLMLTQDLLKAVIKDIQKSIATNEKSYVHCKSGKGRSATAVVGARSYHVILALKEKGVPLTKKQIDEIILEQNNQVKEARPTMAVSVTQSHALREALYKLYEENLDVNTQKKVTTAETAETAETVALASFLSMGALGVGVTIGAAVLSSETVTVVVTVTSEVTGEVRVVELGEQKKEMDLNYFKDVLLFQMEEDYNLSVSFYYPGSTQKIENSKKLNELKGIKDTLTLSATLSEGE